MADPKRVSFVSLGCAKNLVDSEKMLGQLAEAGCVITEDEQDADVAVINTCGFLDESRQEADEVIKVIEQAGVRVAGRTAKVGFSDFVVSRAAEKFLRTETA